MRFQVILLLVALLMLVAARRVSGQPDTWEKVQALPPGARIELFLASDKTVTGTLTEVSPDGVTLTRKRDSMQVARSDIRRMWVLGKGSRLKNAGIAALVGFAMGCPIGAAKAGYLGDMNNPRLGTRAGFCLVIGGFAGGIAAGITAPFPATKRTLVYRSLVAKP